MHVHAGVTKTKSELGIQSVSVQCLTTCHMLLCSSMCSCFDQDTVFNTSHISHRQLIASISYVAHKSIC